MSFAGEDQLEAIMDEVRAEIQRAMRKFPPYNSAHEGKAVIEEELEELWDEIKANKGREIPAMEEAIQVAATAIRYVYDLRGGI